MSEYIIDIDWGDGYVYIDEVRRDDKGERRYYLGSLRPDDPWGDKISDDRRSYPSKEAAAEAIRLRIQNKMQRFERDLQERMRG